MQQDSATFIYDLRLQYTFRDVSRASDVASAV